MVEIRGVPQDPTGEREKERVSLYPFCNLDRLWRDGISPRVWPEQLTWAEFQGRMKNVCMSEGRLPKLQLKTGVPHPKCSNHHLVSSMESPSRWCSLHHITRKKSIAGGRRKNPPQWTRPGSPKILMEASRNVDSVAESKLLPPEGFGKESLGEQTALLLPCTATPRGLGHAFHKETNQQRKVEFSTPVH